MPANPALPVQGHELMLPGFALQQSLGMRGLENLRSSLKLFFNWVFFLVFLFGFFAIANLANTLVASFGC